MVHCKLGFASIVLIRWCAAEVDSSTEDWRKYSPYSILFMPDVLSGLDKAGVCAYVNIMTYVGDPCNTHSFSSVTFGFVLSWLRKTPSGRLITALWSDLNSLLIIGSLVQYFGTNVSLFLILISSFVKKLLRFCIWPSNSNYCLTGPVWSESLQGNGPWVGQHFKNPFLALRF